MKNLIASFIVASLFSACGGNKTVTVTQNSAPNSNVNLTVRRSNETSVIGHSADKQVLPNANQTNSTNSVGSQTENSPMAKAIDVSEMTAGIENAEKASKAKANDPKLKDVLAEAYFARAFALTEAAQYRAALGDFRKGLKLKPNAEEAKKMHDQIIDIFKSIGREPPKEGAEPTPLAFEKNS